MHKWSSNPCDLCNTNKFLRVYSLAKVTAWQSSNIGCFFCCLFLEIMVKNKVVIKERDAWSDLANFIGQMVAKYAEVMGLDQLPDPDCYLRMKRIKQLYTELYKTENIEKFRSIIITIERNAAA